MNQFDIILLLTLFLALCMIILGVRNMSKQPVKLPDNKDFQVPGEQKNKRRDELVKYITDKAIDDYENKLMKELEISSDKDLQKIANGYEIIDELANKGKSVDV